MNIPQTSYSLIYNSKDITTDVSGQALGITYTDKIGGEADTLEVSLEDTDLKWQNGWYPEKGDTLDFILRHNGQQLNCGKFEIDELASEGSADGGDIFNMRAIAAGISKKLRTKNSYAHEDKSLREIANTVAANLGLRLVGNIPQLILHRAHQFRETDLSFLNRLGSQYGYIFSVRGTDLIFTWYEELEKRGASLVLNKSDLISYSMRDTTHKTFKQARVKHHNAAKKEALEVTTFASGTESTKRVDVLEIRSRVENKKQAEAKAKYALFKNNTQGLGGDILIPGTLLFVAGNNVQINGLGHFSGIFQVMESTHTLSRSEGYRTSGNIKRVKTIDPAFFKP